tara:strand:- start:5627 stop:5932 length:306 start_codon:yes stop_codon:yes gene_type:complete
MYRARLAGLFDINDVNRQMDKLIKDVQKRTFQTARDLTPVRTGNARRNWTQDTTSTGFDVTNSVPYIVHLDKGSSRQAPRGISKPTARKMAGYIRTRRLSR